MPGRDLRERLHFDAGNGAAERSEQLAAIEVVISQFELMTCLVELRPRGEQIGVRLIERGLGANTPFQKFLFALEVGLGVVNRRLSLLHAGACLLDLRLQRPRVYFRQQVTQLNLLTDLQIDRLELPGNLE